VTKILFLILPNVHLLDLAGPDQVFLEAKEQGADIAVEYCCIDDVHTSTNLPLGKLEKFNNKNVKTGDYIIVPGAEVNILLSKKITEHRQLKNWIIKSYEAGAIICSICTGAFFLAATGILNGKKCTTHWKRTKELKEKFPLINMVENILFTEDKRVLTSAGVTAGIDLALHIVSRLKDDNFSFKIARELVIYIRRQGNDPQQSIFMMYRNHIHGGIHKVQDYLQENIQKKINLDHLASVACMSQRNLTRVFKKETSISVNQYINLIRKERINELSKNPEITRKDMAKLCGLASERHLIRLMNTN
jgi:transcriptional regulator GlxA family with amidase domain